MKMCVIFTLLLLVVLASAEEDNVGKIESVEKKCQEKTGVSEESLQKIMRLEEVDDPLVKENALCTLKAYGVMDDDGNIFPDKFEEKLKPEIGADEAKRVAEKCAVKKDSPEETAHQTLWCATEENALTDTSQEQ
ncbi:odorant binding protein C15 [Tribolium castaneum]|uniref:Odorant binding protein C15 n=1 Tax=Tribolium castaneum TaxID=7070 RepID=D2A053_TRICA|nr:PREDICTED: B1 protein [Tribolium castaneum]XP_015834821.1 PREDICTED: B1 protein [Tribolium castaneum]XP_975510.1 PREDICTED: B1 protein [Tribolium castaneum]EFA02826.1 odorant binding protein C15 [Tribolium castaneum]|eukprot:XP_015834820.1 PREDICTED: B1 protein [Tribolium castaneum]